jgi:hypothetical protein
MAQALGWGSELVTDLRQRGKGCSARQHQNINSRGPARSPAPSRRRPHRRDHPHAGANALALQHQDIARAVAGSLSRRTDHPWEDLEQIAMVGIILASRRYAPERVTSCLSRVATPTARCTTSCGIERDCGVGVMPLGPIEPL